MSKKTTKIDQLIEADQKSIEASHKKLRKIALLFESGKYYKFKSSHDDSFQYGHFNEVQDISDDRMILNFHSILSPYELFDDCIYVIDYLKYEVIEITKEEFEAVDLACQQIAKQQKELFGIEQKGIKPRKT
jgi:hypothetical protein